MPGKKSRTKKPDTGANLGFEAKLWAAADALRNNMDAAEYKHVVLGLAEPRTDNRHWTYGKAPRRIELRPALGCGSPQ